MCSIFKKGIWFLRVSLSIKPTNPYFMVLLLWNDFWQVLKVGLVFEVLFKKLQWVHILKVSADFERLSHKKTPRNVFSCDVFNQSLNTNFKKHFSFSSVTMVWWKRLLLLVNQKCDWALKCSLSTEEPLLSIHQKHAAHIFPYSLCMVQKKKLKEKKSALNCLSLILNSDS